MAYAFRMFSNSGWQTRRGSLPSAFSHALERRRKREYESGIQTAAENGKNGKGHQRGFERPECSLVLSRPGRTAQGNHQNAPGRRQDGHWNGPAPDHVESGALHGEEHQENDNPVSCCDLGWLRPGSTATSFFASWVLTPQSARRARAAGRASVATPVLVRGPWLGAEATLW